MKKVIISAMICLITFLVILSINSKEEKEINKNNNISIILETEEGNIETNSFPSEYDYDYSNVVCENTNDNITPTFNNKTWKLNLSVEEETIDGNFNCTIYFKENPEPNPPVLDDNMIPVYYDKEDNVWKKADVTNESEEHKWYDYERGMWANSVTVSPVRRDTYVFADPGTTISMTFIETMQVWIPRYKYKIWNYNLDGTSASEEQQIVVKFENGTNSTGSIRCEDNIQGSGGNGTSEICKLDNVTCTDSLCNNEYYTHPAFTFGSDELTGFWVGKFELSGETTSPKVLPNLEGRFNARLSIISNSIMSMNDSGNTYGFTTKVDTHMIKNMEWGSIAYLTHSKYGTCNNGKCTEMGRNNNSNYITGCGSEPGSTSSTTCNEYNTTLGMRASTTGNIYGVYDMSGGSVEPTMGNVASPDGTTMMSGGASTSNSGYSGVVYDDGAYNNYIGTYSYPDKKYYDKYSFATNIDISLGKLGDATRESYSLERSWYDGNRGFAHVIYPWIARGGSASNTNSGIFFYTNSTGHSTFSVSSRFIIVP